MKKIVIGLIAGILVGSVGTAAASSSTVKAVFQKFNLQIQGLDIPIEPLVHEGTTYLPVRDVAGLLGYEVNYTAATRTIKLSKGEGTDSVLGNVLDNVDDKKVNDEKLAANDAISGKNLIELLKKQYPELYQNNKISFDENDGLLTFNDQEFTLPKDEQGNFSIDALIQAGIIPN